jgi:hypothetical protein
MFLDVLSLKDINVWLMMSLKMSYIPNSEYLMLYPMKIIIMKIFQSNLSYKKDQNLPLFCFHKKDA